MTREQVSTTPPRAGGMQRCRRPWHASRSYISHPRRHCGARLSNCANAIRHFLIRVKAFFKHYQPSNELSELRRRGRTKSSVRSILDI
jgi:hypothetical protein